MRFYFRDPRWQLVPHDELNYVPVLFRASPDMPYRLACPFPFLVDPTRKLHNCLRITEFTRDEVRPQRAGVAWHAALTDF